MIGQFQPFLSLTATQFADPPLAAPAIVRATSVATEQANDLIWLAMGN